MGNINNSSDIARKDRIVKFRISEKEVRDMESQARYLGFPDTSKYIRHVLFRKNISTQNFREKTIKYIANHDLLSRRINKNLSLISDLLNDNADSKINEELLSETKEILAEIDDLIADLDNQIKLLSATK